MSDFLVKDENGNPYIERPIHVVASPYKTGSTSIGQALLAVGAGSRDMKFNGKLLKEMKETIRAWRKLVPFRIRAADFVKESGADVRRDFAPFMGRIARFDIFSDAPVGHGHIHPFIIKALAPQAKFIWVNREFDAWVKSVENWEVTHPVVYPQHTDWVDDREGRIEALRLKWTRQYNRFKRCERNFPEDCLELSLEELHDFGPLCDYYGLPNPGAPFPIENRSLG